MAFKPFGAPGSVKKSAPAPKAAAVATKKVGGSASKAVAAAPKKVKKDMTWGGRYALYSTLHILLDTYVH